MAVDPYTRLSVPVSVPEHVSYALASPFSYDTARNQVHRQLTQFAGELRQTTKKGQRWHCATGPTTTLSPSSRAGEPYSISMCACSGPPSGIAARVQCARYDPFRHQPG